MKVSPSILASDLANLRREVELLADAGADLLHADIMDGHYVPNLTFGLPLLQKIREVTSLPLDVHLMVTNPACYIDKLASLGNVAYLSWHPETEFHNHRLIEKVKSLGIKAGWAINPGTSIDIIDPVITDLDFLLLMSVNPGFSGQSFIPAVYDKLAKLREKNKLRQTPLEVAVDGGVNSENAPLLAQAGVNIVVAGSYIFSSSDYKVAISSLKLAT